MSASTDHRELIRPPPINTTVAQLLRSNDVQYCYCRRVSDIATHMDLNINDKGFSEYWDRAGLFSVATKTIYLAEEGWDCGEPYRYTAEQKQHAYGHETGHAVDHCLGRPSLSDEFKDAWRSDIAKNWWSQDVKEKIFGRLLEETTGPLELWADFCGFAISGDTGAVGTAYFPAALEVFNRQICGLELGPIKLTQYREVMFPGRGQPTSPRP